MALALGPDHNLPAILPSLGVRGSDLHGSKKTSLMWVEFVTSFCVGLRDSDWAGCRYIYISKDTFMGLRPSSKQCLLQQLDDFPY